MRELIVIALIVACCYYLVRSRMIFTAAVMRLIGDGTFAVEVAGSSYYLHSFKKICGRRTADCINRKTEAHLTLENDNKLDEHAVRVSIEKHTVGYLPRSAAFGFREAVIAVGLGAATVFECAAHIRGDWDSVLGKQGNYGVWLDLPAVNAH